MRKVPFAVAIVVLLVALVLVAKTLAYGSKQLTAEAAPSVSIDTAAAAARLAGAVAFRTISFQGTAGVDTTQFQGLHTYLQQSFPTVHARLGRERVAGFNLLYRWPGSDTALQPVLLLAHQDVVPVESGTEGRWTEPPFAGRISAGYVWGRGAVDDKGNLVAILEAVETLLQQGFQPRRTVYLAFGADEEVGGAGARQIAALLGSRNVHPEFLMDEGGAIAQGVVPGARTPLALVGIAEKGYMSVELTVHVPGGHSSMPPPETAVGILSAAINRLQRQQLRAAIRGPTAQMLDYLGPELPFFGRLALANRWLFGGLIARRLAATPQGNAMLRTTTAPTIFQGGVKDNVLPSTARAVVNFRILPGDSSATVLRHVRRAIADARIEVRPLEGPLSEPSPISDANSPSFRLLQRTIREIVPDAVVVPWLVVGGTDARHYAALTRDSYRFSAARIGPGDLERIHGTNERVAVANYGEMVRFYVLLIRNSAG